MYHIASHFQAATRLFQILQISCNQQISNIHFSAHMHIQFHWVSFSPAFKRFSHALFIIYLGFFCIYIYLCQNLFTFKHLCDFISDQSTVTIFFFKLRNNTSNMCSFSIYFFPLFFSHKRMNTARFYLQQAKNIYYIDLFRSVCILRSYRCCTFFFFFSLLLEDEGAGKAEASYEEIKTKKNREQRCLNKSKMYQAGVWSVS